MPGRNIYYLFIAALISLFFVAKTSVSDQIIRNVSLLVQKNALEKPEEKTIYEGALSGIVDAVGDHPYTTYLPPKDQPNYLREIQGQYAGVGLSSFIRDTLSGEFYFVPQHGKPASKAGLKFGDRIVEVDGQKASELSVFDLTEMIRGDENTSVALKIRPSTHISKVSSPSNDTEQNLTEVFLTRTLIQQEVVLGDRYDEKGNWIFTLEDVPEIGYVQIDQFVDTTGFQTHQALKNLDEQGVSKVILDFRGNPGGFLPDAIEICNEFLAYGSPIVETRDRNGTIQQYTATQNNKRRFKVAILIDGDSASASEIVSAALQDAEVAVIVGSRSYGKGTVQSIYELPFKLGVLRMTTASFWRPSGRPIHRPQNSSEESEWGVSPNEGYEVQVSPFQKFYSQWIRRIRVSTNATENLHPQTLSFLSHQMNGLISLFYKGNNIQKAEVATEIGLSPETIYELLGDTTSNGVLSTSQVSMDVSTIDESVFKPQGRAPYFDPQLDRAVDYLQSIQE